MRDPHDLPVSLIGADRDDALSATPLNAIVVERSPLAVAVFGDRKNGGVRRQDFHAHHFVLVVERNTPDTRSASPHRPNLVFGEANRFACSGRENNFVVALRTPHSDQFVAVGQVDRDDAGFPWIRERFEGGLLDQAIAGAEQDEVTRNIFVTKAPYREHGLHDFAFSQLQDIDDRLAPRCAAELRQRMDLHPMHATLVGEEQDVRVRRSHKEMLHEVFVAGHHAARTLATAPLCAVLGNGVALDVAEMRKRHDHVFFDDQVFVGNAVDRNREFGASIVAEFFCDFVDLFDDDVEDTLITCEQCL